MAKRKNPSDEKGQDNENLNDDSFGLPDLDYKPLETSQEETTPPTKNEEVKSEPVAESSHNTTETKRETPTRTYQAYMDEEEEERSKAPIIVGIVIALALLVAGGLYYFYVYKPNQKEKIERLAREAEEKRLAAEKERLEREAAEAKRQHEADSLAALNATPKEGTIETLTDRTKRYYVVVTSAIDGDLVMDYAKKLSAKGISTKIIPPYGKYKFSRLAIGDFDTFANAQASADAAKADYGGAVWVLKF